MTLLQPELQIPAALVVNRSAPFARLASAVR